MDDPEGGHWHRREGSKDTGGYFNTFSMILWYDLVRFIEGQVGCKCFSHKEMKGSDRKTNYFQVYWMSDSCRFFNILKKFSYCKNHQRGGKSASLYACPLRSVEKWWPICVSTRKTVRNIVSSFLLKHEKNIVWFFKVLFLPLYICRVGEIL